ncbi:MAG: hypothetical protein R3F61_10720 [Myxococcota bacterium]
MIALLATAAASTFEVEATTTYRVQQAGAVVDDLYLFVTSEGVTSGGRFRVESDDAHVGVEMYGAIDGLAIVDGFRPQRWGGARALFGFRGLTPLTTTLVHLKLGAATWDVREIAVDDHTPFPLGTVGVEVRRFARGRVQCLEGEVMLNDRVWAGEIRTRVGYGVRDTGLYLTVGGATSRFSSWTPGDLLQVTYQVETSVLWRPGAGR